MMDFITEKLNQLRKDGLYRELRVLEGEQSPHMRLRDRDVLLFCSNDYLGLAAHPSLKEAVRDAVNRYGCGAGASRLISGTMELHESLEKKIASFKKKDAALLFNSGYSANIGLISVVMEKGDIVYCDKLNHASILNGVQLSRATLKRYPHKDMDGLERLLSAPTPKPGARKLIVTDGLFSMDGDLAPLPDIVYLAEKHKAMVMVDDAHATGVFGENGRGTAEYFGVEDRIGIHMGTLSKALGSFGGYIAGSEDLRELLINRAGSFIYTTALPPSVLAASRVSIDIIQANPSAGRSLLKKAACFRDSLKGIGFDTMESESQIIPLFIGDAEIARRMSQRLLEKGILVPAIRPPTVPAGKSRLRVSLSAAHTEKDIERALFEFGEAGREFCLIR